MKIGERIQARRKELHLSRERLSEMVERAPMTIYKWETSQTEPTASEIQSLAKALDTTVHDLFGEVVLTKDLLMNPQQVLRILPVMRAKGLLSLEEIMQAVLQDQAATKK